MQLRLSGLVFTVKRKQQEHVIDISLKEISAQRIDVAAAAMLRRQGVALTERGTSVNKATAPLRPVPCGKSGDWGPWCGHQPYARGIL